MLEVEVELVARAVVCPHCGRGGVEVKERPVVWVRDLSICGRWRGCAGASGDSPVTRAAGG